jgi:predicted Fe-Mo cluster-binding NifX family protein
MKIAVSATGTTLDATVDPRFGRCRYFVIVDPDTMDFEAVDNSASAAGGGAGIAAAQSVVGKGVEAVLTGNCGPNAFRVLEAGNIRVMTRVSGTVQEAVNNYKEGKYQASPQATVVDHYGLGQQ